MSKIAMWHETDPRAELLAKLGDVEYEVANNEVLAITYMRPEKTAGGIVLTARNLNEDLYQSKVHLVWKLGPLCEFYGFVLKPHDWIVIRPSDAFAFDLNGVQVRLIVDKFVRGKIQDPNVIW